MTAISSWQDVFLNVDLLTVAPVYRSYVDRWRSYFSCCGEEAFMRRVIRRYEHYWLPLLADWSPQRQDLEPPPDVHWVWHLHLLQPRHYAAYCRDRFGRVLPHRLHPYAKDAALCEQLTASIWRETYAGTTEAFDVDVEILRRGFGGAASAGDAKLAQFVIDAARREREFVYQVSLPHYTDQSFLYSAVERYKKLLVFRRLRNSVTIRQPIDVQLIWRVHLLHPVQYAEDTRRVLGATDYTVGEEDEVYPPSSSLPSAAEIRQTCSADLRLMTDSSRAWMSLFACPLYADGTGYRGMAVGDGSDGGRVVISRFPMENYETPAVDCCDVVIDDLCVDELWNGERRICVDAKLLGANSFASALVFTTSGAVGSVMSSTVGRTQASSDGGTLSGTIEGASGTGLGSTYFDGKLNRGIELCIYARKGFACFSQRRLIASKQFNPVQYLHQSHSLPSSSDGRTVKVSLPKVTYTDPRITFKLTLDAAKPNPHVFTMDRNAFEVGQLSADLRSFTALTKPWSTALISDEPRFSSARHSLKCREGGLAFGVEVIKHEPTNLGAVLLYHNNQKLVCAAYTIDNHQLPTSSQVLEMCPVTFEAYDHAMLLRNSEGDFAVTVARWQQINNNGPESRLRFETYFCQSRTTHSFDVGADEMTSVSVDDVTIDLPTGRFTVDAGCDTLAEHVTWAFAVGVLFVTSQKSSASMMINSGVDSVRGGHESVRNRPLLAATAGGDTASKRKTSGPAMRAHLNKKASRQRKKSASFTFLLACGLQVDYALYGDNSVSSMTSYTSRPAVTTGNTSLRGASDNHGGTKMNGVPAQQYYGGKQPEEIRL